MRQGGCSEALAEQYKQDRDEYDPAGRKMAERDRLARRGMEAQARSAVAEGSSAGVSSPQVRTPTAGRTGQRTRSAWRYRARQGDSS